MHDKYCFIATLLTVAEDTTSWSCLNVASALPSPWTPGQHSVTVVQWLSPVYLVHQASDLPGGEGRSTPAIIAVGVIVPVVTILVVTTAKFTGHEQAEEAANATP